MSTQFRTLARRLTLAAALAATTSAVAANSDTVQLSGTVSSAAQVTAVATTRAGDLDLSGTTEKIFKVADVAMSTNNITGVTVTITSGNLSNGTVEADIAFKVTTVADESTPPVGTAFDVVSGGNYTYSTAESENTDPKSVARDLYIAYTPAASQDPGTYTGTIQLTVADNS